MQISIQSLEVTYNKVPYRFIVKKMFNTSRNETSFHCWAPEDNESAKNLIRNEVLMFEWDRQSLQLRHYSDHPVNNILKDAIAENFLSERA
jgi:hypothetical protein